ncbi:MAG: exosortase [Candidatus Korobacteraceae bacterium]
MSTVLEAEVRVPSEPPRQPAPYSWWQPALVFLFLGLCYYDVVAALVRDWWYDDDASHGFVVPLFSLYLLWQRRADLETVPAQPSWSGLVAVASGLSMLIVGNLGAELFLSRFSLVIVLGGLVVQFFGWPMFRKILFPWAFLFLMIPPPSIIFNQVTFSLQLVASQLAKDSLNAIGVPVLLEGNILRLPVMPLEVAEACSGIRSLISLGVVAIIYGFLLEQSSWMRLAIAAASVPLAVAANAARIVGTGVLVEYWDPDKALGFFHGFSGWVVFMIAMGLLMAVHAALRFGANLATRRSQWA